MSQNYQNYNNKKSSSKGGTFILILAALAAFGIVFANPANAHVKSAPGWYQTIEQLIAPVGQQLDHNFGPKKTGSISTPSGVVLSWQ